MGQNFPKKNIKTNLFSLLKFLCTNLIDTPIPSVTIQLCEKCNYTSKNKNNYLTHILNNHSTTFFISIKYIFIMFIF
jgi:hypothetical protein